VHKSRLLHSARALWLAGVALFAALTLWATQHALFPGELEVTRVLQHRESAGWLRYEELADLAGVRTTFYIAAFGGLTLFTLLRQWRLCTLVILVCPLLELGPLFKNLVERPRPTAAVVVAIREFPGGYAFPSGHSLQAAIVATVLAIAAHELLSGPPKWVVQALAVWLALTVGWERVFDGVHWPTDVAGGLRLGCLSTIAIWRVIGYVARMPQRAEAQAPG
jgi:membrane-associated phospholipid phosphatase